MKKLTASIVSILVLFPVLARGNTVATGYLSFDNLIPSDEGSPGVNAFNIWNLTGDPAAGGYALPPDFPVMTSVEFLSSSLTLTLEDGTTQVISLGDVGIGPYLDAGTGLPPLSLQFPDTTQIISAFFAASLDQTTILLSDGSTLIVPSSFSVTLTPSVGSYLVPGDSAVMTVEATVPEAGTVLLLLMSGLAGVLLRRCKMF